MLNEFIDGSHYSRRTSDFSVFIIITTPEMTLNISPAQTLPVQVYFHDVSGNNEIFPNTLYIVPVAPGQAPVFKRMNDVSDCEIFSKSYRSLSHNLLQVFTSNDLKPHGKCLGRNWVRYPVALEVPCETAHYLMQNLEEIHNLSIAPYSSKLHARYHPFLPMIAMLHNPTFQRQGFDNLQTLATETSSVAQKSRSQSIPFRLQI